MFSFFKTVATAATSAAVRLPQPATTPVVALPAGRAFKPAPAAQTTAPSKRDRYRAEQARYHAQCRRAMSF